MSSSTTVHGSVAPGFEGVRAEFAAVVATDPGHGGAQLAAHLDGRRVVDLWTGEGMAGDSLLSVYSSAKGAAHLVVALLVQRGVLGLDEEVARHWPEFAAEGKAGITPSDTAARWAPSRSPILAAEWRAATPAAGSAPKAVVRRRTTRWPRPSSAPPRRCAEDGCPAGLRDRPGTRRRHWSE
ncbi:serine hydrolase domain-containing protein [Kitasatospora sp. NBC_01246]|uniref:serine hydrolase domain-containing protein n=1 Tax=Kitasatospora sp. NBC_01246 TaxID=2903570 RepID=UPI003FA5F8AC